MFDFDVLTTEELEAAFVKINGIIQARKDSRRYELIEKVCDAMNELHKEFPGVSLNFSSSCPHCQEEEDYDLLDYYCNGRPMSKNDFTTMF